MSELLKDERHITDAGNTKRISIPSEWEKLLKTEELEKLPVKIVENDKGIGMLVQPEEPVKKSEMIAGITDLQSE